jgi:hypothetical protein
MSVGGKKNQQIPYVILNQSTTQHRKHHSWMSPNPWMLEIDHGNIISQAPHTWCKFQIDTTKTIETKSQMKVSLFW